MFSSMGKQDDNRFVAAGQTFFFDIKNNAKEKEYET